MSNYAENIIKILAGLPAFLRKPMLKHRLEEFFNKDKEEQLEIIDNAINAIPEVEFDILANLIRTWVEALDNLGDNKMEEMFFFYASMLSNKPEIIHKLNINGMIEIYNSLEDDLKSNVSSAIRNAIDRLENKDKLLANIPDEAKRLIY